MVTSAASRKMFTPILPSLARGGCRACFSTQNKVESLSQKLVSGSRMALSRAITLIESTRADHREQASALLDRVAELRGQQRVHTSDGCGTSDTSDTSGTNSTDGGEGDVSRTFRLGIAGPPGAGKSTFIEALGEYITSAAGGGHRLAVIAVDPSSSVTGGSILGDKTRMTELSRNENAFVRPCPSRGALGGRGGSQ